MNSSHCDLPSLPPGEPITHVHLHDTKTSPNLRLDPPEEEDQPQDLTSDVFVYGRPNPDGSENTPHMSIINGSSYNILIEWETGEQTWEPLSNIIASDPYTCAVYAKKHNLLNTPGWKLLKKHARTARRLVGTLKKSKYRQARVSRKYKHVWEVPRDYAHALQLDIHNGINKWKEAIDLEIEQIKEYQVFKDSGKAVYDKKHITNSPKGHQKIRVHFVFDVKHCGKFKGRLVADGHFTKEPMETVYSGMFLAEPNNLELWGAGAGHA